MQTNSDSQMSLDDSNNTSGNRQIEIDILGELHTTTAWSGGTCRL